MDPHMTDEILDRLSLIASQREVTILYACEAGSRAWGFESTDSDYDVRFIYAHDYKYYMSIEESRRDTIERVYADLDLDMVGWDLRKTLRLFYKGNPSLLEWIRSPIIYDADPKFYEKMERAADDYFSPVAAYWHYRGMGNNNWRVYIQKKRQVSRLKKYLYVLRPLLACRYIVKHGALPPVVFEELLALSDLKQDVRDEIGDLLEKKRKGTEMGTGYYPAMYQMFDYFYSNESPEKPPAPKQTTARLNTIFRTFVK